jgi:hypothetical protein
MYSSPSAAKGPSRGQYDTHAPADREKDRDRGRRGEESSEVDEKVYSKLQVRRMSAERRDITSKMLS